MNNKPAFSIFVLVTLMIWNCKSDDAATPNAQDNQMVALLNGETWESDGVSAEISTENFTISGFSEADSGSIIIIMLDEFRVGNHSLDPNGLNTAAMILGNHLSQNLSFGFHSEEGIVEIENINEIDSLVSGKFYFSGRKNSVGEKMSLTDGVFKNIKYTAK